MSWQCAVSSEAAHLTTKVQERVRHLWTASFERALEITILLAAKASMAAQYTTVREVHQTHHWLIGLTLHSETHCFIMTHHFYKQSWQWKDFLIAQCLAATLMAVDLQTQVASFWASLRLQTQHLFSLQMTQQFEVKQILNSSGSREISLEMHSANTMQQLEQCNYKKSK